MSIFDQILSISSADRAAKPAITSAELVNTESHLALDDNRGYLAHPSHVRYVYRGEAAEQRLAQLEVSGDA